MRHQICSCYRLSFSSLSSFYLNDFNSCLISTSLIKALDLLNQFSHLQQYFPLPSQSHLTKAQSILFRHYVHFIAKSSGGSKATSCLATTPNHVSWFTPPSSNMFYGDCLTFVNNSRAKHSVIFFLIPGRYAIHPLAKILFLW